jgi:hypothetical protein
MRTGVHSLRSKKYCGQLKYKVHTSFKICGTSSITTLFGFVRDYQSRARTIYQSNVVEVFYGNRRCYYFVELFFEFTI